MISYKNTERNLFNMNNSDFNQTKNKKEPAKKILFKNLEHENRYPALMAQLPEFYRSSSEIQAVIYLIALVETVQPDVADQIFDFSWRMIKPEVLDASWQTEKTKRALLLAFNLFNSSPVPINHIFGRSHWDKYFLEAIYLRFHFTCDFDEETYLNDLM